MQTSYCLMYLFRFVSAIDWRFLLCNAVNVFKMIAKSDSLFRKTNGNCKLLDTQRKKGKRRILFAFTFPAEVEAQNMLLLIPHRSSFYPLIQILRKKTFERCHLTLPGLL